MIPTLYHVVREYAGFTLADYKPKICPNTSSLSDQAVSLSHALYLGQVELVELVAPTEFILVSVCFIFFALGILPLHTLQHLLEEVGVALELLQREAHLGLL